MRANVQVRVVQVQVQVRKKGEEEEMKIRMIKKSVPTIRTEVFLKLVSRGLISV